MYILCYSVKGNTDDAKALIHDIDTGKICAWLTRVMDATSIDIIPCMRTYVPSR